MRKLKKKLKLWLNTLAKENVHLRGIIRWFMNAYGLLHYKLSTLFCRVDPTTVIFASFDGRSYSDSPKAIFEYMLRSGEFDDFTLVWGIRKGQVRRLRKQLNKLRLQAGIERHPELLELPEEQRTQELVPGPRVVVVQYNGARWRKSLASATYWVFNYKVPDYLKPKKSQVFLQTWHGTPLKRLGYDLEHFDNVLNTKEGMQKRYGMETQKFSYFVSPNAYSSECFKSAWRMDDFGKGDIILQTGYPRNDVLTTYSREQVDAIKTRLFGQFYLPYERLAGHKTVILYAPTYRSDQHEVGVGYTYQEELDFDRLRAELGESCIILFRAHYLVANRFNFEKYAGFVYNVSKVPDMSDLLLVSDVLVTDYSSSMFDFSILKRPMIFYMYDLEHYRDESNGFYFDPALELPGPIVQTQDDLVAAIKGLPEWFDYDEKYERFNEKYNALEDGNASKRVVEAVFGTRSGGR